VKGDEARAKVSRDGNDEVIQWVAGFNTHRHPLQ
jgi:hypothetical protein